MFAIYPLGRWGARSCSAVMRSDRRLLLMAACGLCMAAAAMLPGPTCIASSKYCDVTRAAPSHPTMIGGRLVKRVRRFFGKDEDAEEAAFKVSVAKAAEEVKALLDGDFAQAAARAGKAVSEEELRVGMESVTSEVEKLNPDPDPDPDPDSHLTQVEKLLGEQVSDAAARAERAAREAAAKAQVQLKAKTR